MNITPEEIDKFRGLDALAYNWWQTLSQYEVGQIFGESTRKNDPPPIHIVLTYFLGWKPTHDSYDVMAQAKSYFDPEYNPCSSNHMSRPKFAQIGGQRCLYFEYVGHLYHVNVRKISGTEYVWETFNYDRQLKGAPVERFTFRNLHGFLALYDFVGSRTKVNMLMGDGSIVRHTMPMDAQRYTGDVLATSVYPSDITEHMHEMRDKVEGDGDGKEAERA